MRRRSRDALAGPMAGLAAFRIALGAASWIAPRAIGRVYGLPEERLTPELEYMTRVFGVTRTAPSRARRGCRAGSA